MRIIAGEFRGRRLRGPKTEITRPITDRVKQSLFDILSPRIEDARVYDCFAGTGSMGLESLSRGAAHATFFERDREAVKLLRENIDDLAVSDRATIVATDIFKWFAAEPAVERADIVFLDPPYKMLRDRAEDLRNLASAIHVNPSGILVFRHDARDQLDLPRLVRIDERNYGGMTIEILQPK